MFYLNPFPNDKFLDSSKLKVFADDNFKFDENGRKFLKWVENTVGKGEIARYEQFFLFPQCFQKACFPGASKGVIVWEWIKDGCLMFGFTLSLHICGSLATAFDTLEASPPSPPPLFLSQSLVVDATVRKQIFSHFFVIIEEHLRIYLNRNHQKSSNATDR